MSWIFLFPFHRRRSGGIGRLNNSQISRLVSRKLWILDLGEKNYRKKSEEKLFQ
jgi:hypothetical protein